MGRLICNHCGYVMKLPPINWQAAFAGDMDVFPTCEQCGRKIASGYVEVEDGVVRECDPEGQVFQQHAFHYGDHSPLYPSDLSMNVYPDGINIAVSTDDGRDETQQMSLIMLPDDQARKLANAILEALAKREANDGT